MGPRKRESAVTADGELTVEERFAVARIRAGNLSYREIAAQVSDVLDRKVNHEYVRRLAGGASPSPVTAETVELEVFLGVCRVLGVRPEWLWPELLPRLERLAGLTRDWLSLR